MTRRVLHLVTASAAALVTTAALSAAPAHATFPGENGLIAFDYTVNPFNHSTYRFDPTTGNQIGFNFYTGERFGQSSWSPDGIRLAVVSQGITSGHGAIWVWDTSKDTSNGAEPGEFTQITPAMPPLSGPTWSPDGTQIAYSDGNDIWRVQALPNMNPVNLTADTSATVTEPDWSPDGTKIAYTSLASGSFDIFAMDATNGANKVPVVQHAEYDASPSWSPDGSKIAFVSRRHDATGDIYTTAADGSGSAFQVESRPGFPDTAPAWSPDGTQIAFSSVFTPAAPDDRYIFIARADGSGDPIQRGIGRDNNPSWGVSTMCHGFPATIRGTAVGETINGTGGSDVIVAMGGNDTINGGGGTDYICGGAGNDTMDGGSGAEPDHFVGGPGTDTVSYAERVAPLTVTLADSAPAPSDDGAAGEGDMVHEDVENVIGGTGNDTLTGNAAANTLQGGAGNDTLIGLNGRDGMYGGSGSDTVSYASRSSAVNADLTGGTGDDGGSQDGATGARDSIGTDVEKLVGGSANDILTGNSLANTLLGMGGNDWLTGGNGRDGMYGGAGTDTASYSARTTAVNADLTGGTGDDGGIEDGAVGARDSIGTDVEQLVGGAGNDTLVGNALTNRLTGMKGADSLFGSAGNDVLMANDGVKDTRLDGGTGTDSGLFDAIDPPRISVP